MRRIVEAVYDGKAFQPTEPITLKPNTRVRLSIETEEESSSSFLDVAQSLALDGPPDWSSNIEEYLYGSKSIDGS